MRNRPPPWSWLLLQQVVARQNLCSLKILLSDKVFVPAPARIKYMYHCGAWQMKFAEFGADDPRFKFVEGLPIFDDLPGGTEHTVMVIDIFMKHSHHRNMTVFFLLKFVWSRHLFMQQRDHTATLW